MAGTSESSWPKRTGSWEAEGRWPQRLESRPALCPLPIPHEHPTHPAAMAQGLPTLHTVPWPWASPPNTDLASVSLLKALLCYDKAGRYDRGVHENPFGGCMATSSEGRDVTACPLPRPRPPQRNSHKGASSHAQRRSLGTLNQPKNRNHLHILQQKKG